MVGVFALKVVPPEARQRVENDVIEFSRDKVVFDRLTATAGRQPGRRRGLRQGARRAALQRCRDRAYHRPQADPVENGDEVVALPSGARVPNGTR